MPKWKWLSAAVVFLFLAGCGSVRPVTYTTFTECPKSEMTALEQIPANSHIGSIEAQAVVMKNLANLNYYVQNLRDTVTCYENQVSKVSHSDQPEDL